MAIWHLRSKRKPTGGKLKPLMKKKKRQRGMVFLETKIEKTKSRAKKSRGGEKKIKLLSVDFVNVADQKTGKIEKTKIISVVENQANPHYVRRNIITKGAVIKTDKGLVKVTSRPNQNGVVNGILVEGK